MNLLRKIGLADGILPTKRLEYQGFWKHEKSEGHDNWGLLASEKACKYGIATHFPEVVELRRSPFCPPSPVNDKFSHVYTAVLYPNNTISILIDGQEKKSVDLLSDNFDPLVLSSRMIADPDNSDERAKIPDSKVVKPEDWDEDAHMTLRI
ncbi:hypothetical protein L7F22_032822 [Adiantum nelumboides]|nr:hypothetical protein [Adiantum nelumboides]